MKEYWEQTQRLRKRIKRKINEIHLMRQRAEGMNGSGGDMPKCSSPDHSKMEAAVYKIMALEEEVKEIQAEYDELLGDMEKRINRVDDADERDLLTKRYLEFKTWAVIAAEFGYSEQSIYRLHAKAAEKLRVHEST